ncbi:MAG TPA: nucleoside triphosphate pyrophosphatase [Steroidobacteraceae bacterium]|jgi:septum formation protein|nr:nucleoside triphosphate pyrophosphatase [Steroidobacteraceae bacterium]
MFQDFVYLASGSPRRRELLQQIGVSFRVVGTAVDEAVQPAETAPAYVVRLAAAKAEAGWTRSRGAHPAPVLAADTAVVLDGKILGKPADRQDAESMLRQLSGRTHEVLTAVALRTAGCLQSRISRSEVTFRAIPADEARGYWETGEACDKAGAYAIQGRAAIFVADLRGSFSGVMGLPLFETAELLHGAGVSLWHAQRQPP